MNITNTTKKKELDKYNCEKKWALILLRHLNSKGNDYIIKEDHTPPPNWADVDVYAESFSGKFSPLYIQLCLDVKPGDEGYERIEGNLNACILKKFGNTLDAIRCKAEKYTAQKRDFSQITLIIQSLYLIEDDKKYRIPELYSNCCQYKFKAIYLLAPKGRIYSGHNKQGREAPELVFQIL